MRVFTTSLEHARDLGAAALFGEKYGDFVRVVEIDDFSRELCGGTHVGSTSELGIFKIVSEGSVGANVRRIEAVSGRAAVAYYRERDQLVREAVEKLGVADDQLLPSIERIQSRLVDLDAEVRKFVADSARDVVQTLVDRAEARDGVNIVAEVVEARDMDHLLALVDQVRDRLQPAVVALGADLAGKGTLVVGVSRGIEGVDAGQVVRGSAKEFGGGGGGNAQLGRGGGGDPARLPEALRAARAAVLEALAG